MLIAHCSFAIAIMIIEFNPNGNDTIATARVQ